MPKGGRLLRLQSALSVMNLAIGSFKGESYIKVMDWLADKAAVTKSGVGSAMKNTNRGCHVNHSFNQFSFKFSGVAS
jgi:hypothetical protein